MDNDVRSLSDVLTDSNSEDSSTEDIDEKCDASDINTVKIKLANSDSEIGEYGNDDFKARNNNNLVLDLRNLNHTNDFQNGEDEEEEKYEKLSEVIEEPEELSPKVTSILDQESTPSFRCREISEKSLVLQERIASLKNLILSLREELQREVSLWRRERDEFQILQEKSDLIALEEATAAARAAAEAYAAESPLSNDLDRGLQYNCCNYVAAGEILDVNPEQTLSELTILEYEKKLAKYQDALALAQAEKRYNMRRQLAANTYRQKLIEVERLCDEELEKIKQNASSLQPLKQMVSQWYRSDRCGGDAAEEKSSSPFAVQKCYSKSNFCGAASNAGNKIDAEVNMAPEIFVSKFNNVDENDFSFSKGANFKLETYTDFNRNNALSLKWESSNFNLGSSPGNL